MATISEALTIAMEHHQVGRLQAAEQIYRQILQVEPNHPDALHLLGVIAFTVGKPEIAIEHIGRALQRKPDIVEAHNNLGIALSDQGKLDEAVDCYRRALALKPGFAEAHFNLANALKDQGKLDEAVDCYRRALALKPGFAEAHFNLANALKDQGKLNEAVDCYRRALALKPDYAEAHGNLGLALSHQGKLDEAVDCYWRALALKPDYAKAHINLGLALRDQGKLDEAVDCYRQALALKPDFAEAHFNLANALKDQGDLDEAVDYYRRALVLKTDNAEAHNNLGIVLSDQGKLDEAVDCYRWALALKPDLAEAHNNLGNALKDQGKLDEAVACFQRALALKPDYAEAHSNLGLALKDQGKLDEAIACYRKALSLKHDYHAAHSNLVYTMYFCADQDAQAIYEEHRHWSRQHAEPLAQCIEPHANDRGSERRLRVGYVSPDFRGHVVGRFLLPLLEAHDHQNVEVFCYASVRVPDALTDCFRATADVWRDVLGSTDEQLAHTIRQDRIDILVDLTMHMADNRLLVFARKPAPVQVTYLAYCGTTGLRTMDYRLTDPYLDPPGAGKQAYTEQSLHLPETYWCYRPPDLAPAVNELPALEAGHVTFGCLNNFCKVTPPTIAAWGRLLRLLPDARLLLHASPGSHRERVRQHFAAFGVAAERLTFTGRVPLLEYFRAYQRVDVALDPFPYGGGTTTCDALWMGVPVVSLAGQTAVGRGGASILSNVGLTELVARTSEHYVEIAANLAKDPLGLAKLRAALRARMLASPLMDAPRFARNMEAAYRTMWRHWCAGR